MSEQSSRNFWPHDTSVPAAVIFALLFGVGAIIHIYQMCRYHAWNFTIFIIGAIMMSAGYLFRAFSINSPSSLILYILQSLLIILPPSLYAATVYMLLGRIILLLNTPHLSLIRPSRITKVFVAGDATAFLIQLSAGGMMAMDSLASTGNNLMLMGLFVQLLFFGFFVIAAGVFHYRVVHARSLIGSPRLEKRYGRYHWSTLLKTLYFVAGIIIVRCVFRVVEFAEGHDGEIRQNELYMYVFDTVPMLAVQSVFHVMHSGRVLPPDSVLKGGEGDYAMEGC